MIVAIVSRADADFVLDDKEGLIKVSKEQKDYYEAQLQNQPKPLLDKCYDFLAALEQLGPLLIAGWAIHNTQNSLNHQRELVDAQKAIYDTEQQLLNYENVRLTTDNIRLNNNFPNWSDFTEGDRDQVRANHPDAQQILLNHGKIFYNDQKKEVLRLKKEQLNFETQKANTEVGFEMAKLVLHVVQNAPAIVEAVKDLLIIGADIIDTIASNAWNWMTMPKIKPVDKILHIVKAPQIEEAQEFAEESYEADSANPIYNEIKPMGDFGIETAEAA